MIIQRIMERKVIIGRDVGCATVVTQLPICRIYGDSIPGMAHASVGGKGAKRKACVGCTWLAMFLKFVLKWIWYWLVFCYNWWNFCFKFVYTHIYIWSTNRDGIKNWQCFYLLWRLARKSHSLYRRSKFWTAPCLLICIIMRQMLIFTCSICEKV